LKLIDNGRIKNNHTDNQWIKENHIPIFAKTYYLE